MTTNAIKEECATQKLETRELKEGIVAGAAVSAKIRKVLCKGGPMPSQAIMLADIANALQFCRIPPFYPKGISPHIVEHAFRIIRWVDIESEQSGVAAITDFERGIVAGHLVATEIRMLLLKSRECMSHQQMLNYLLEQSQLPRVRAFFPLTMPKEIIQLAFSMIEGFELL